MTVGQRSAAQAATTEGLRGGGLASAGEEGGAATMAAVSPVLPAMAASTIGLGESATVGSPIKICEATARETNAAADAVPSIGQAAVRRIATGTTGSGPGAASGTLATTAGRAASSQG